MKQFHKLLAWVLSVAIMMTFIPGLALNVSAATTNVASVTIDGVTTEYATLNEAFTAASYKTATITLLCDYDAAYEAKQPYTSGKTTETVFDLGGHTLSYTNLVADLYTSRNPTFSGTCTIQNGTIEADNRYFALSSYASSECTMTIKGNVTINTTNEYCNALGVLKNATLIVESGATITSNNSDKNKPGAICVYDGGKVILNGGTVVNNGTEPAISTYNNGSGATVVINGGTVADMKVSNAYFNVDNSAEVAGNAWYKLTNNIEDDKATVSYSENTTVYEENTYGLGGETVTLTATPLSDVTISKILANDIEAANEESEYSFTMPNNLVALTAETGLNEPIPIVTDIKFNSDSTAYDEDTNTFYVSDSNPFILTITGENLTMFNEMGGLKGLFKGETSNSGWVIINVDIYSDTKAYISINTSSMTYILSNSFNSRKIVAVMVENRNTQYGKTVNVNIAHAPTYMLRINESEGGTVNHNNFFSNYIAVGAKVILTVTPDNGYGLESLVVGGDDVTASVVNNEYTFTMPDEVVVVNAVFKATGYTVTFVDWNGDKIDTQIVSRGSAAVAPPNPTRAGWKFAGWDKAFDNVTGNLTVTAQYTEKAVVSITETPQTYTFDNKSKSFVIAGTSLDGFSIRYQQNGQDVTPVNAGNYDVIIKRDEDSNYKMFEKTLNGALVIEKATASITVDTTPIEKFYGEALTLPEATTNMGSVTVDKDATEIKNKGTYTVTYTVAGTSNYDGDTKTVSVTIKPLPVNIRWENAEGLIYDGTEKKITAVLANKVNGDNVNLTVTGQVAATAKGKYTATVTAVDNDNYTITNGTNLTKNWAISATGSKSSGGGGGGYASTYTIKFETNGGSDVASKSVVRYGKITEPDAPVKEGFKFEGWYKEKELKTAYNFDTKISSSFTLYAKWVEENKEDDDNTSGNSGHICPSLQFSDLDITKWYHLDTDYVIANDIFRGMTDTIFAPNGNITRGMMITVLYRAEGEPEVTGTSTFEDVEKNAYYEKAVIWGQQNGIIKGYSKTEYAPNQDILREQIAAIMHRYAVFKGYDVTEGENVNLLSYSDASQISEYATEAIKWAVGSGMIKGRTENTLNPKEFATRVEIAAMLHRFIEKH